MNRGLADFEMEKAIRTWRWFQYTKIIIRVDKLGYNLAPEGQKRIFRLIYDYITSHRNSKVVYGQSFVFSPDTVAFNVLNKDLPKILEALTSILQDPNSLTKEFVETSKTSLVEAIYPFLKRAVKPRDCERASAIGCSPAKIGAEIPTIGIFEGGF